MLDILCIGDAKLDIFLQIQPDNPHVGLKEDKLEISFGEKIYIEKYITETGGNATNTAVGIARLGFNAGVCAEIGIDEFSQRILNNLKLEKVNTEFLLQTEAEKSSFSVILNYKSDRIIFSEHVLRDHNFNFSSLKTKLIYITSLGKKWENAYEYALKFAKENKIKLAFNPGTLQIESKSRTVLDIVENCDYLFLNKEEAEQLLYGSEFGVGNKNTEKLLYGLSGLGAKNVIITDSENGSYLKDEQEHNYCLGIAPAKALSKTGAGDSYTAGFLAAVLDGQTNKEAMIWGSVNAASVIEKVGAENGLLTKNELLEKIKNLNNFYPKSL